MNNALWLISDTHFGHRNIVRFSQRPETHEIIMLSEWIRLVKDTDQILHLGDVWMKGSPWRWAAIIDRLPGEKFLILGNHDKATRTMYERAGFTIVDPFVHNGVAFTHRPVTEMFPIEDPDWRVNIHGHTHGNSFWPGEGELYSDRTYINLCVEKTDLKPRQLGGVL